MKTNVKKPFIPRDKPKSWVIGVLAGLSGLLIAGPILLVASYFRWRLLYYLGAFIFVICWLTFAVMWFVGLAQRLGEKYRQISEKDWRDQVW